MGKYVDILNKGFRSDATLYAESIPHLLHWDLAYFWVLERDSHLRPAEWAEQIHAWRYLVALLLTGQLEVTSEEIIEPFLNHTKPYGINEVYWLKIKHEGDCVGVLSPTVLVRPLPDYSRGDLHSWMQKLPHPEKHTPDVLAHFLKLTLKYLNELSNDSHRQSPVLSGLAEILEREFKGAEEMSAPPGGTYQSIPILKQISWIQEEFEPCIETIEILVGSQSSRPVGMAYVPRCERCRASLPRAQSAPPVEITDEGGHVFLDCSSPNCGHRTKLFLSQFLIWMRSREVTIWDQQDIFPVPASGFPPSPTIDGCEILFEWQPAQLPGAERVNRFLRFRFPLDKQLKKRKLGGIFYDKLLVPGELKEFTGLPFPLEWRETIENLAEIVAEPDLSNVRVVYNRIKVHGLPEPINRVYGSLSLKHAPDLAVGSYPNPQATAEKWMWYRIFLHGPERQQYRLQAPESTKISKILPWLMESTNGFPELFSIHSADDAGVSFYTQPVHTSLPSQSPARMHLGVDFGTTNTAIYFLPPGKSQENFDQLLNNPQGHCVEPPRFAEVAHWLARPIAGSAQPVGDFLPGADYGKTGAARFIIPTVLWQINDRFLICWDPDQSPPQSTSAGNFELPVHARSDFKLRPDAAVWRRAFLREALLLTLPWIWKRSLDSGALGTNNLNVSLGFAFPLALSGPAREEMNNNLVQLSRELKELCGLDFETNAISESAACIKLLGSPNSTDTFLVADMGGGTIDLALFTANNPDPDQIGSVQFAGEKFLDIFAAKKQLDQLRLGDSIRQGNCSYGGDQTANVLLRRYLGIVFEFLRTMITAYRLHKPDQTIHLVLAGNGWHLAEVFNAGSASYTARQLFKQYYSHLTNDLMGDSKLRLSDPLQQLPSSKHLVAVGALKHALMQGASQIDPNRFAPSRLPAGRRMTFTGETDRGEENNKGSRRIKVKKTIEGSRREKRIEWFDLVGEPVRFTVHSPEALRDLNLSIDFTQMAPLNEPWRAYLLEAVFSAGHERDIPYPEEMRLRDQIRSEIPQAFMPTLGKGPLQLILEHHWAEWLKR